MSECPDIGPLHIDIAVRGSFLKERQRVLTARGIGPEKHRAFRGFASTIGMRRHIFGLLAFAHYVEPLFAKRCYDRFNSIVWSD